MGDGASHALTEISEVAAQEFGIERVDQGKSKKPSKKSMRSSERVKKGCEHSCSDHNELMNPTLWGTLPPELLQLVFAHLPVDEISRLQFLSKEWLQRISSPEFHRICSLIYPKMVCLITRDQRNLFWVRVLDHLQKWHIYKIVVGRPDVDWTATLAPTMSVGCEDGGLVCFVTHLHSDSKKKKACRSFFFTVVNPLTRTSRELPPLFDLFYTCTVQMQVDRETYAFKVFVFATRVVWTNAITKCTHSGASTHLYDSLTGEWMTTYGFSVFPDQKKYLAYCFARIDSAFHKEQLFVLQLGLDGPANEETANQSQMYYIEEFHWETVWVKVRTHRCDPFEHPPRTVYRMILHACDGFLMVIAKLNSDRVNEGFGNHLAWLYDLSTMKWSILDLPELSVGRRTYDPYDRCMFTVALPGGRKLQTKRDGTYEVDLMFEPQWAI